ncbi:protein NRT1/ PTR FAMILY 5.6 [Citrus sinensis]|uniref:Protein NRT1/ PTR FAMILY 5.6 n=1 Tax=Citrus sinensis TaxID=2711 RepID=A0ACB8I4J4_CITSI|nr:protein NRT1/ PTR FAMILY 5.6 [Citrus sinensis]
MSLLSRMPIMSICVRANVGREVLGESFLEKLCNQLLRFSVIVVDKSINLVLVFPWMFVDKPQTGRLGYSGRLDNLLLRLRIFKSIHISKSCNIYEYSGCNISNSYGCCRLDFVLCHSSSQNPHFFNCLLQPSSREFSETNFELLNMIGIILLAVGEVGAAPLLGPFLAYQLRQHGEGGRTENSNEDQVMAQKRVWWRFAWCCGTAAAFYANNIKTWKKTFMFTLLFMGGSLILLLLGIPFYHNTEIPPIDRFAIIRVVKTSLKKKHLNYPLSPELFFSNDEGNVLHLSPRIKLLRWIDKAAIIETSSTSKEQEEAGTLCTVAQRQAQVLRTFIGMVMSTVCCVVAWQVEVRRLEKSNQLENMSMFWLVPQFCLLGLMEGLALHGCDEYSSSHFPERMEYHGSAISSFFVGIGSIFNIFFILANKGDFAETLDDSRLDKYYKSLTVISAVNVCYNLLLSILYIGSDQSVDNEGLQTNNTIGSDQSVDNEGLQTNNTIGSDQIVDNEGLQTNDTTDADAI